MSIWNKNLKNKTDAELMLLLRKGDKEAFSALYDRYADKLVSFFYRMLNKDSEKSQDFMHDLFVKIIENPASFDTNQRFDTWVFHVAFNMCKNEYRKMAVRDEFRGNYMYADHAIDEPSLHRIDHLKFTEELNENLGMLDERQRSAFILKYQQELSLKDIAEIMDCPEGTIKSRLFYAIKFLSEKLTVFDPKVN